MEVKAIAKYVRVQPRKVRIIADEVRGKDANYAAAQLRYHPSKSARALRKVLVSAMANAQENNGLNPDTLRIATIMVDEGPRLKRMRARAMGRGYRILKKTSHITVVVEEAEPKPEIKAHGTKAKPRPSFASGKRPQSSAKPVEATDETVNEAVTNETATEETAAPATAPEVAEPFTAPAEDTTPAEAPAPANAPEEEAN